MQQTDAWGKSKEIVTTKKTRGGVQPLSLLVKGKPKRWGAPEKAGRGDNGPEAKLKRDNGQTREKNLLRRV